MQQKLQEWLKKFERHPRTINDQIKFVREFLDFITGKMRECELWRNASEQEFENAKEGIEKLVMNRLHKLTFTPAIKGPPVTDDIERDNILYQKIEIFRWVREQHLDIPITPHNEAFFDFAKKELLKINDYKAPRDKLICILNCCKVIYGLIKLVDGEEGADKFLPVLIFVILKANPEYLMSNVQSPEKLQSEAGYYLSSLMSAISFIENMDLHSLTITKEEFDKNIEMTMKELDRERPKLAENTREINYENAIHPLSRSIAQNNNKGTIINHAQAKAIFEKGTIIAQKTIQKPLDIVGKILSDLNQDIQKSTSSHDSRDYAHIEEEVNRVTKRDIQKSLESLKSMFPNIESDLCKEVFYGKECNINEAIDKLLEIASPFLMTKSEHGEGDAIDFVDLNKLSLDPENNIDPEN
ncbi:15820_t:CDS:10 [Entrophospora sp. SA101]|nr:15820_t:CDS:10 [Entrophospora sp. SA101]